MKEDITMPIAQTLLPISVSNVVVTMNKMHVCVFVKLSTYVLTVIVHNYIGSIIV